MARVPHLRLAEKGFRPDDVEIKEIDLCMYHISLLTIPPTHLTCICKVQAENFNLEYLKTNPNGTVPSLSIHLKNIPG